jgi:hypothetical protein
MGMAVMDALRRIFRRDDTIGTNLVRDSLDIDETRHWGMRDKASAYKAIAAIKFEQQRLLRLRKALEKRSGRLTPKRVRSAVRPTGSQFAEMGLSRAIQSSDTAAMYETQLEAIEQREQAVHDLWIDLERFARS